MSKISMIFSDIDGTLLNNQHEIVPEVWTAVNKANKQEVAFYLASARPPASMAKIRHELGLKTPLVAYNGALIADYNEKDGGLEPLFSHPLLEQDCRDILHFVETELLDVVINLYAGDVWYVQNSQDSDVQEEARISQMQPVELPLSEAFSQPLAIHKLLVIGAPADLAELKNFVNDNLLDATAYFSKVNYLEITQVSVSKLTALKEMTELKGIPREAVLAIGDNFNDLPMILEAGVGVAMANAPSEVQACSDFVTKSNQEAGVAHALNLFL